MTDITLCELGETEFEYLETYSSSCLKVKRALKYAGLSYTSRRGTKPAAFRDLSPTGQVPILLIGAEVVCNSTNIVSRIEGMVPGVFSKGMNQCAIAEAWLWEEMVDSALSGFGIAAAWCPYGHHIWPGKDRSWLLGFAFQHI